MIKKLDVYNLDDFCNYSYKDDPIEELWAQLQAIQDKINEIIEVING